MFFRSPTQADLAQANTLMADTDGCLISASFPDNDDPTRFRRTLIVELEGQVVGIGAVSSNWLHPSRLTVDVVVASGFRRQGIGTTLLERLIDEVPTHDHRPLKAACWSDDEASVAFWRKHGFVPIMQTQIGTIDLANQASVIPFTAILPNWITIVSGNHLALDDSLWDEIAMLHERVYRASHGWSPVERIDLPLARRLFLDPDDLIPDALLVAMRDGRPFAMASLRALTDAGNCELGWAGGDPVSGEAGKQVADLLVSQCLGLARERGWIVDVEADRSDPVLSRVVEAWPLMNCRAWVNHGRPR